MTRRNGTQREDPADRLAVHHARIHELLDRLRVIADDRDPESADWNDVGELANLAQRLAELVPCTDCNGTGYATGRCPDSRRDRDNAAAHAACSTCDGSGHERV